MTFPKNLQEKRDELAIEFQNAIWRLEPYKDPPDEGMSFKRGFHAALYLLLPEVRKLSETLSTIVINDPDETTSYQARQALQSWNEFLEGGE